MAASSPDNSKLFGRFSGGNGGLVGRESALEALTKEAEICRSERRGKIVFLVGEGGVGKTALLDRFLSLLSDGIVQPVILRGSCERTQQSPYFPVVEALARFLESDAPAARRLRIREFLVDSFAGAIELVPGLRVLSGTVARVKEVRARGYLPEFTNYEGRAVISFAKFLTGLASDRPLVLAIDDLQWADSETVGLLHYLSGMLDRHGVFLVCTVRSEYLASADPDSATVAFYADALSKRLALKLDVQRISLADTPEAIRFLIGEHSLSKELTLALHNETEGNPFFLREVLYLLVERGDLARVDGRASAIRPIELRDVPESIRGIVRARVRRLSQPHRRALDAASVVGATFDANLIASTIEQRQIEILEELRDLEEIHSMVVRLNGHHRFYHVKIQETIYDELPPELRRRYHEAVARALSLRGGVEAEGGAASHFLLAGDPVNALRLFGKTSEELVRSQNWRSAKDALDQLITLELAAVSATPSTSLASSFYLRGLAQYHTGRYRDALEDARASQRMSSQAGAVDPRAYHLAGAAAYFLGDRSSCLEAYGESLKLAEVSGQWELTFRTHLSLAAACDQFGDYIAMEKHYAHAAGIADAHADARARASVLMKYGMIVMDEPAQVIPRLEEARRMFASLDDSRGVAACDHNLGNEYFYLRDLERAEAHFTSALAGFEEMGGIEQCYPLNNLGMVYQVRGNLADSERVLIRALDCHLTEYHRVFILNNLANTRRLSGMPGESVRILESILPAVELDKDPVTPETTFYNLGMAYLDLGDINRSVSNLEKSFSKRTKSNAALNRGKRWKALARAYTGLGDRARADLCQAKAIELLQSSVPDLWYYRDIDWEVADLAFYE